jgi:hypothetical protein
MVDGEPARGIGRDAAGDVLGFRSWKLWDGDLSRPAR